VRSSCFIKDKLQHFIGTTFGLVLTSVLATSCRSLYDSNQYLKDPALGKIAKQDWNFLYGYTDAETKRPEGIDYIIVLQSIKPSYACPNAEDPDQQTPQVVVGIDGKLGDLKIGGKSGKYETGEDVFKYSKTERKGTAAFFDPKKKQSNPYTFATTGKIRVTKISEQFIEGYIVAKYNPEYFINGKFKAKVCKWGQLH
jgi:hypothetical protein